MIEKILLVGIEPFWIETGVDNLKKLISDFDKDRGLYGFTHLTPVQETKVMRDFVATIPGAKLKYRNELHMKLKMKERSAEWLQRRLKDFGKEYHTNSIRRWINGTSKPPADSARLVEQILLAR